jgi:hypothetical protein
MHTVHTGVCAAGFEHTTPSCYRMLHTRPFWFKFIRIQPFTVLKATKWHTPPLITVPHPKPLSNSCYCRQTNIPTYYAVLPCIINDRTFRLLVCYCFFRLYLLHTSKVQTNMFHQSLIQQRGVIWASDLEVKGNLLMERQRSRWSSLILEDIQQRGDGCGKSKQ